MIAPTVLVVGGLARLAPFYRAETANCDVVVANADSTWLEHRLRSADAVVMVPGNVSHRAAHRVRSYSRRHRLRVILASSAGVGAVCRSIEAAARCA